MAQHKLQGDPEIPLILRKSARAKRITLRVSQVDGRVTVTLPRRVSEQEALAFAIEKEAWIRKHLSQQCNVLNITQGATLPIAGRDHLVVSGAGRTVRAEGSELQVPGHPDAVGRRVLGYLKARARDTLVEASDFYAERLGRPYSGISLRDPRSRWGSCSSAGRLMYSWRLVLAPPSVLNYVVAHEVSHLAEMNHSDRFWAQVERIHGPHDEARRWLRTDGVALHRYRFDD